MSARDDEPLSDVAAFRRLLPWLRGDAGLYALALLLAPVTAATVIAQPWLLQRAIDQHIAPAAAGTGDLSGLADAAALYLVSIVLGFVFQTGHMLALSYAAMRTITRLRRAVFQHTLSLGQSFFDRTPTGRLLTRATSDVEALGETLTAGAITIVLDVLQVVGVVTAMLWLDARLTATLLLVAPPLALIVELLRKRLRALFGLIRDAQAALNAYLSERLDGLEVVQLHRDEARTQAAFRARLHRYRDAAVRTNIYDALMYATVDGLTSVTMALLLAYGAFAAEGTLTAGLMAAFIEYVARLFRPIQEFSGKVAVIQRAGAALVKLFGLLDVEERVQGGTAQLGDVRGELVLEDVSFAYGDGPDVLHGVSLTVPPCTTVAVVGRTGSGKSTIGRLLSAAYCGYRGSIRLDGHELCDLSPDAVRAAVGTVRQDVQLFPADVRFNLSLGRDLSDDALLDAVRRAHASDVVARLGGLDGRVEHAGRNLSAGEAQLLSFARTLAHDPPLLVLDEATASVDSATEARIQAATAEVLAARTTLVIAHRLSTITTADLIVVLDGGRVEEQGTHAELLRKGGAYAALFEAQLATPEAPAVAL